MNSYQPADPDDIEALHAEALAGYNPTTEERWRKSAHLANLILRTLPGSRVATGNPRNSSERTDYITATPNPPLTVFGPDGRFIVSFLKDGTWIEATGRVSSTAGFLEGGPPSVVRLILREAGINIPAAPLYTSRSRISLPHSDGLRRMLTPQPTHTWLDDAELPKGHTWDEHTPASICRESAATRLIFAPYDPNSCTFARATHPRWGVESLRIPALKDDPLRSHASRSIEQVRPGDCLLTVGPKFPAPVGQLELQDIELEYIELEDFQGTLAWFPQRVVRVAPEGEGHLRVWVARDNDVMNDNADPDDLGLTMQVGAQETMILNDDDAQAVYQHFQLNVFCEQCGNRAKPIVYGMPTSADPSYLAIGGCIIEEDAPNYTCSCGHTWKDYDDGNVDAY